MALRCPTTFGTLPPPSEEAPQLRNLAELGILAEPGVFLLASREIKMEIQG